MTRRFNLPALALVVAIPFLTCRQALAEADSAPEPGVDVQPRGPVHEAFAKPTAPNAEPGAVVPKKPPEPIPELPPDVRPKDEDAEWFSGYWAWDADKKDFVWVSGLWRVPPPDRKWTPGYWTKADKGWRWVTGFWAPVKQDAIEYLDAPPGSLDNGPSTEAPDEDSVYVPGSWVPRRGRYYWRPGFWNTPYRDWVWTPAHYSWTPAGYVFIDGYWDYCLEDRGMLFAPVYFDQPLWTTPGWCYRPRFAIGLAGLFGSFWVGPGYGSYYFGDFYGSGYAGWGFSPWCLYGPRFYDPLFSYYRWHYRGNAGWYRGLHDTFVARQAGDVLRPPRTFSQQTALARVSPSGSAVQMVTPANQLSRDTTQVKTLSATQLTTQRAAVQNSRDLGKIRSSFEQGAAKEFASSGIRSAADRNWKPSTDVRSQSASPVFSGAITNSPGGRPGIISGPAPAPVLRGGPVSSTPRYSPSPVGTSSGRGYSGGSSGRSFGGSSGGGSGGGRGGGSSSGGGGRGGGSSGGRR